MRHELPRVTADDPPNPLTLNLPTGWRCAGRSTRLAGFQALDTSSLSRGRRQSIHHGRLRPEPLHRRLIAQQHEATDPTRGRSGHARAALRHPLRIPGYRPTHPARLPRLGQSSASATSFRIIFSASRAAPTSSCLSSSHASSWVTHTTVGVYRLIQYNLTGARFCSLDDAKLSPKKIEWIIVREPI